MRESRRENRGGRGTREKWESRSESLKIYEKRETRRSRDSRRRQVLRVSQRGREHSRERRRDRSHASDRRRCLKHEFQSRNHRRHSTSSRRCSGRQRRVARPLWRRRGVSPVGISRFPLRGGRRPPFVPVLKKMVDGGSPESEGQGKTIFMDNLNRSVNEKALRWLLRLVGSIKRVFISRKRRPNNPLAFAFVTMASASQVQPAVEWTRGRFFMGYKLFVRQAKYEVTADVGSGEKVQNQEGGKVANGVPGFAKQTLGSDEAGGDSEKGEDGDGVSLQNGAPGFAKQMLGNNEAGGDSAKGDGGDGVPLQNGVDFVAGGKCRKVGSGREVFPGNSNDRPRMQIVVSCCCRERGPCLEESPVSKDGCLLPPVSKEGKDTPDIGTFTGGNDGAGSILNGANSFFWSGVPTNFSGWVYPVPMQGFGQYGWWGPLQGWGGNYFWPYDSGLAWYPVGYEHLSQPPPATVMPVNLNGDPNQGVMGRGSRPPISIRKPAIERGSDLDPVVEDIVSNERRGAEDELLRFEKLGDVEGMETGPGADRSGYDHAVSHTQMVEGAVNSSPQMEQEEKGEEGDGEDLRNLFDPEFPPGFEPGIGFSDPVVSPDDEYDEFVKDEARQTLLLAKKIGCSIIDEGRALSNLESIIREHKGFSQSRQVPSPSVGGDSDSHSRTTSRASSKGRVGSKKGNIGFSKFSRISKVVTRSRGRVRATS